ncbi:hypothetical protein EYF80_034867 [Liparis tanakae]|uniref:Uncharacterized protein n=1 Tax=Liparis tanakae TaxID=230148 RepID=A0A4Z2GQD1_9TELE|nr:hypothetical protein EYF80_034867 [Liparis tanakae]
MKAARRSSAPIGRPISREVGRVDPVGEEVQLDDSGELRGLRPDHLYMKSLLSQKSTNKNKKTHVWMSDDFLCLPSDSSSSHLGAPGVSGRDDFLTQDSSEVDPCPCKHRLLRQKVQGERRIPAAHGRRRHLQTSGVTHVFRTCLVVMGSDRKFSSHRHRVTLLRNSARPPPAVRREQDRKLDIPGGPSKSPVASLSGFRLTGN